MRQAIIYTRFSPRANADKCESCEVQRDYCEKYAAAHGMEVMACFDDPDVSGADEFREKLLPLARAQGRLLSQHGVQAAVEEAAANGLL